MSLIKEESRLNSTNIQQSELLENAPPGFIIDVPAQTSQESASTSASTSTGALQPNTLPVLSGVKFRVNNDDDVNAVDDDDDDYDSDEDAKNDSKRFISSLQPEEDEIDVNERTAKVNPNLSKNKMTTTKL